MKDAIMVLLLPKNWRMIIDSLMLFRENTDKHNWSEGEIDKQMHDILLTAGVGDAKRVTPEAYAICFPDGPAVVQIKFKKGDKP